MASGSPRQPRGKQPKGTFLGTTRRRRVVTRPAGCWRPRWCGACRVLGQPRPPTSATVPVGRIAGAAPRGAASCGAGHELWSVRLPAVSLLCRRAVTGRDTPGNPSLRPGWPSTLPGRQVRPHSLTEGLFATHRCFPRTRAPARRQRTPSFTNQTAPAWLGRVGTRPLFTPPDKPQEGNGNSQRGSNGKPRRPATQTARSSPPPRKPRPPVEDSRHTHNPAPPHKPAQVPSTPTRNHHTNTHPAPNPPTNHNPKQHPRHHTNPRAGQPDAQLGCQHNRVNSK